MNKEIWKDIPGYENKYQASDMGRVRNKKTNHILKFDKKICGSGYHNVVFGNKKSEMIHRIICKTFHGIPKNKKMTVNHINGNKLDNRSENLEWVTKKLNNQLAWKNGQCEKTRKKKKKRMTGENNIKNKLNSKQIEEIIKLRGLMYQKEIAKKYNITQAQVSSIQLGKSLGFIHKAIKQA